MKIIKITRKHMYGDNTNFSEFFFKAIYPALNQINPEGSGWFV